VVRQVRQVRQVATRRQTVGSSEHGRPSLIFAAGNGSNESAQMRIDTLWHVVEVIASFEKRH